MTVFPGVCSVTSCPFNLGNGRVACDWLRNGRGRCHHPTYREAWALAHELEQAQEADPAPVILAAVADLQELPARVGSLVGRAAAADAPMSPERARQLILELEGA